MSLFASNCAECLPQKCTINDLISSKTDWNDWINSKSIKAYIKYVKNETPVNFEDFFNYIKNKQKLIQGNAEPAIKTFRTLEIFGNKSVDLTTDQPVVLGSLIIDKIYIRRNPRKVLNVLQKLNNLQTNLSSNDNNNTSENTTSATAIPVKIKIFVNWNEIFETEVNVSEAEDTIIDVALPGTAILRRGDPRILIGTPNMPISEQCFYTIKLSGVCANNLMLNKDIQCYDELLESDFVNIPSNIHYLCPTGKILELNNEDLINNLYRSDPSITDFLSK